MNKDGILDNYLHDLDQERLTKKRSLQYVNDSLSHNNHTKIN
jgi:hypothetical protein